MSDLEKYFTEHNQPHIVILARKHWAVFLGQLLLSVIILIIPILLVWMISSASQINFSGPATNILIMLGSVFYLIALTFIFASWITFYYDLFLITEDEVVDVTQVGFWSRKVSQLSLLRVQDVSSHVKGIFPTLFNFGDVLIETAGEKSETFHLVAVPKPQEFAAKVLELHNLLVAKEAREGQIADGEGRLTPSINFSTISVPPPKPPEPPTNANNGEMNKDDLNRGGEVKF